LVAGARTVLAVGLVSLYVLVCGPPLLLWSMLTRRPALLYAASGLGVRVGFALAGIRVRITGGEHRQPGRVYACNHTSNVESPAMFLALRPLFPRVRVLYKSELRRLPVLVWAFDVAGFVPLERRNPDQSRPAIERAASALTEGYSFFIFPEGTRSRTGELLPFKKGGFVMALKAQAPVVPVALIGARAAMRKGSALIWPAVVTVAFLPPVPTMGLSFDDREALIARVRGAIQGRLAIGPAAETADH
jgi:1-acyl-sn-glycerol-3-phosphate acyltransferase